MSNNYTHNSNFIFNTNLFGEETNYNIQNINLPGLSFSHIQAGRQSSLLNFQGDTLNFSVLNVEIIVDEELKVWKDIVGSLLKMRDPKSGLGELIEKNSWLIIQDDNSNKVLKIKFINCLIEDIGDMAFNTNEEDEEIFISVSIKYDYYEIE